MDLGKIVSMTESLLYQVAVTLVLLPKTLFKVMTNPTWIPDYIARELAKPDDQRFDDHVSPLLFFVILTIVPNLVANAYWPQIPYSDFATRRALVGQAQALSDEHRFLVYALIWTLLPLGFAVVHLLARKAELSSSQLKPFLYVQCLRVAPLGPLFAARFCVEKGLGAQTAHLGVLDLGTILFALAWVLYSDVRISIHACQNTPARAVVLALTGVAAYYVFITPVVLLSVFLR
jgi:hypothetical protein